MLPDAQQAWAFGQQSGWGDPLRLHRSGRLAAQRLDRAREVVAAAVGARPDEVVFTGSYAQASHAAVAGLALGRRRTGSRIVTTAIDHSSVLNAAAAAGEHQTVGVDSLGHLDLDRWTSEVVGGGYGAGRSPGRQPRGGHPAALRRGDRRRPAGGSSGGAGRRCRPGPGRPVRGRRLVGADRLGRGVRRTGLGRAAGHPQPDAVAGSVPGRRLPGRPLARGTRRAGHPRRRHGPGLLAALRPRGGRAAAGAGGPAARRHRRDRARCRRRRRSGAPTARTC